MNWELILTTFTAIFLAEMGDKTQIVILTLTAESKKPLSVFLGGACAMVLVTAFGVLFGDVVAKFVPATVLRKAAATLFVLIGVWTWFKG